NDDLFFEAWLKENRNNLNTQANRDIIWRSRSSLAAPLLTDVIVSAGSDEMLRYFRAFDFHNGPAKQAALTRLALASSGEKAMYALKHMDASSVRPTPALTAKLNEVLKQYENKIEYIEVINAFDLKARSPSLLAFALQQPDNPVAREAMKTLVKWNQLALLESVFSKKDLSSQLILAKLSQSQMYDPSVIDLMETIVLDSTRELELRRQALQSFGGHSESENRLLALARDGRIPEPLVNVAAGIFQNI